MTTIASRPAYPVDCRALPGRQHIPGLGQGVTESCDYRGGGLHDSRMPPHKIPKGLDHPEGLALAR